MPNSDNTYGTFNKQTNITSQQNSSDVNRIVFNTVQEAKDHFFTADIQAVYDECCTNLQWALMADENGDNTKLKATYDFGTKGTPGIAEADDWAGQFASRIAALSPTVGLSDEIITDSDSAEHLF